MVTKSEEVLRRPDWSKIRLSISENYTGLKKIMREKNLNTVCEEAKCPNIHECWDTRRTAIFMILGTVCTKACRFCVVKTGLPNELDLNESKRVAESVELMNLKHVVITAVARDDLRDADSDVCAETIHKVREKNPSTTIEILPSGMDGDYDVLETLMASGSGVLNHNIETIRRLTPRARAHATYDRALESLRRSKELQPDIPTKSSIMVGLGETIEEICETMGDLHANDVDILTIGQHLQPSHKHLKVQKYYTPLEFGKLRKVTTDKGFRHYQARPLVRSLYHAGEQVNEAAKGRQRQDEAQLNS